jgi:hypothetical protein
MGACQARRDGIYLGPVEVVLLRYVPTNSNDDRTTPFLSTTNTRPARYPPGESFLPYK